jgi:hypothetical protein
MLVKKLLQPMILGWFYLTQKKKLKDLTGKIFIQA